MLGGDFIDVKQCDRNISLKKLSEAGIETYAFVGPIFPKLTPIKDIVEEIGETVDFFCFENLNLRGAYKKRVFEFINANYPEYKKLYEDIYINKKGEYWLDKINEIEKIFANKNTPYKNYFFHDEIKK